MTKTAVKTSNFWQSRRGAAAISVLALVAGYVLGSRAIETGSLQQYFPALVLVVLSINRLIHAVRNQ